MNSVATKSLDLDWGLGLFEELFDSLRLAPVVIARNDDGLVQLFTVAEGRYAVHLKVSRWPDGIKGVGPMPYLLVDACHSHGTRPLQLRVNLIQADGGVYYRFHGVGEFLREVHSSSSRWKRHLLGNLGVQEWIDRAGGCSTFHLKAEGRDLQMLIDGNPPILTIRDGQTLENPPIDAEELCRSASCNDECWIFTCGCGVPGCNGIHSGLLVVHQGGYTIWRNSECPEVPMAVFRRWQYRRAILSVMVALLKEHSREDKPSRDASPTPAMLRTAFKKARAGIDWSRHGWMANPSQSLWAILPHEDI